MRTIVIFLSFMAYTFVVGALISPWVYQLIQSISNGAESGLLKYLNGQDFGKISNRCFMLVAATGIYPMLKAFDAFNKKDLGYDLPRKEFLKEAGKGIPFGIISLSLLAVLIVYFNLRILTPGAGAGDFIGAFLKMIPGAIALGLIEETFFRGIMLNSMSRTLKVAPTVIISSVLFASVHLLRNKSDIEINSADWSTGFYYLSLTLQNYTNPDMLGSWLTLFACGIFLSLVSLHYGNIARCIGIHMGWVLVIKGFEKITDTVNKNKGHWMIGDYDKVTGHLSFIIITVMCIAYWFIFLRGKEGNKKVEEST